MMGPLLLALSPLCLGMALLLWRLGLYKRGEERILQRLGRAFRLVRTGSVRRDWLDPLLLRAGLAHVEFSPGPWLAGWLALTLAAGLLGGWVAALMAWLGLPLLGYFYLSWRCRRRLRQIIQQLPGLLDYSVRSLKAGRTLNEAVLGGIDSTREPLRSAMLRVRRNVQLGVPLEDAVSEFAELYRQDELRMFALGLRINQRHGGNASELLENLIKLIREHEQGDRQLRAMTGETRITAVILGALPLAMVGYFLLANPGYLLAMWRDSHGQLMLLFAFALQAIGCLVLWRMMRSL
ncbi:MULTISPECIES: type II secretion system F family protein [unclassified Pseudomonas]|uniref:type II secretion system F family protein n=1 Tax=unclassified Pseudomonas TaxID=196821 RepID=UPI0024493E9D|nr:MULTISPECIES: type II secretion system F family protein [unclassified Pseudomonas]MDH0305262.1 type II secretion system F family protein [Pseudomonas sp. GD04091]MDH1986859.1 type II secretion system F family protein [Pseudomonas sp. GD03689]